MNITEKINKNTSQIDNLELIDILNKINDEDSKVADAVAKSLSQIEKFVACVIKKIKRGGKLFYIGSGTSGRLGVLDASECPPTFGLDHDIVQGIIAGGEKALKKSVEGAEDSESDAIKITQELINENDIVLGISASSATPFVLSALKESKKIGAVTGILVCNEFDKQNFVDFKISVLVGPEVIAGSTRMKAGTATKMVLNMITTATMIKLNYTYGNLMVSLKPLNKKLINRSANIVSSITKIDKQDAMHVLEKNNYKIKEVIVMIILGVEFSKAEKLLKDKEGSLREVLGGK